MSQILFSTCQEMRVTPNITTGQLYFYLMSFSYPALNPPLLTINSLLDQARSRYKKISFVSGTATWRAYLTHGTISSTLLGILLGQGKAKLGAYHMCHRNRGLLGGGKEEFAAHLGSGRISLII